MSQPSAPLFFFCLLFAAFYSSVWPNSRDWMWFCSPVNDPIASIIHSTVNFIFSKWFASPALLFNPAQQPATHVAVSKLFLILKSFNLFISLFLFSFPTLVIPRLPMPLMMLWECEFERKKMSANFSTTKRCNFLVLPKNTRIYMLSFSFCDFPLYIWNRMTFSEFPYTNFMCDQRCCEGTNNLS